MRRLLVLFLFLLLPASARAQETSKQVFAQAGRAPAGSAQAIDLYQRYTQLEPDDAWGHLALAEALAAARRFQEAEAALQRAATLAPDEEDVAIVRSRVEKARRASLPSFKPSSYFSRDTDANTSFTVGAAGDAAMSGRLRAGVSGARTSIDDGASTATVDRALGTLSVRSKTVRWDTEIGGARITHDRSRTVAVGQTHLRVATGNRGWAADVRVRQTPITSAYSLISAETMLTEARGLIDIPVFAGLKLRGTGQLGSIETSTLYPVGTPRPGRGNQQDYVAVINQNRRTGFGGGLALPYSPVSEISVTGYRLQYDEPGTGQYFAPEYVEVVELGTYAEIYRFDPVTIALDAGVGAQRAKPFGQPTGDLAPALRLWTQVSVPLARYVELSGEFDYYKSQLSTVTTGAGWSSFAGGLSLRWLIS